MADNNKETAPHPRAKQAVIKVRSHKNEYCEFNGILLDTRNPNPRNSLDEIDEFLFEAKLSSFAFNLYNIGEDNNERQPG